MHRQCTDCYHSYLISYGDSETAESLCSEVYFSITGDAKNIPDQLRCFANKPECFLQVLPCGNWFIKYPLNTPTRRNHIQDEVVLNHDS